MMYDEPVEAEGVVLKECNLSVLTQSWRHRSRVRSCRFLSFAGFLRQSTWMHACMICYVQQCHKKGYKDAV